MIVIKIHHSLHRLAKSILRNRFLGYLNVYKYGFDLYIPPGRGCFLYASKRKVFI